MNIRPPQLSFWRRHCLKPVYYVFRLVYLSHCYCDKFINHTWYIINSVLTNVLAFYLDKSQNYPQMKSVFFQKEHEMLQSLCRGDICLDQDKEKGLLNFNILLHLTGFLINAILIPILILTRNPNVNFQLNLIETYSSRYMQLSF